MIESSARVVATGCVASITPAAGRPSATYHDWMMRFTLLGAVCGVIALLALVALIVVYSRKR